MALIHIFCFSFLFFIASCNEASKSPSNEVIEKVTEKQLPKVTAEPITKTVAIIKLGSFDKALFEFVKHKLDSFYSINVIDGGTQDFPKFANVKNTDRYVGDSLLKFLFLHTPKGAQYTLGLTEKDICTRSGKNPHWGVFGLGWQPGPSCIISIFRLTKNVSVDKLKSRLSKVVIHEMGHNFGLKHCPTKGCLMQDADKKISTVDNEKIKFCEECMGKLDSFEVSQTK